MQCPAEDTLHNLAAAANIERHPTQRLRCDSCRLVQEDRTGAFLRRSFTGDSRGKVCDFFERTAAHVEEMSQTLADTRSGTMTSDRLTALMLRATALIPSACAGIRTMLKSTYEMDHNTEVRLERVVERLEGILFAMQPKAFVEEAKVDVESVPSAEWSKKQKQSKNKGKNT